jgi:hypothetical protein
MAKDTRTADWSVPRTEELSLEGIPHPSPELRRSWDDYRRMREAMEWLQELEPDNEVALAMMRHDLTRREAAFRASLLHFGRARA